jgi:hypothetical protein
MAHLIIMHVRRINFFHQLMNLKNLGFFFFFFWLLKLVVSQFKCLVNLDQNMTLVSKLRVKI